MKHLIRTSTEDWTKRRQGREQKDWPNQNYKYCTKRQKCAINL